ncbi:MAG: hypothetical protein IJ568_06520 [Bacilli bacterium]|nr:hypothetical protein [Bacilli bacterium]
MSKNLKIVISISLISLMLAGYKIYTMPPIEDKKLEPITYDNSNTEKELIKKKY